MTPHRDILMALPAPDRLSPWVSIFVHRDQRLSGQVVRVLPDLRASIQIQLQDRYWLRDQAAGSEWQAVPRVAFWGPRQRWCYGHAPSHVRAFALGLSAGGLQALQAGPCSAWLNRVVPLERINPIWARALAVNQNEAFPQWTERVSRWLIEQVGRNLPVSANLAAALPILATQDADAVAQAASACGYSERQFRRLFAYAHGFTPKQYQRVARIDRMLQQIHQRPWDVDPFARQPILFADQPHANREFRSLTGGTPRDYLRAKRQGDRTLRAIAVDAVVPPSAELIAAAD